MASRDWVGKRGNIQKTVMPKRKIAGTIRNEGSSRPAKGEALPGFLSRGRLKACSVSSDTLSLTETIYKFASIGMRSNESSSERMTSRT